ncbi:16S rRNA processing protein RimM [Mycoplasma mycoides subsp. mycoides]|uniref:Ribosome maturation factor RimM n=2 Tax=Mycoplasma mycoides subsp. mycoides TaxID=2103 RepID=Q6MTI2_MYCMS|nr:16S rRNA-processing protein RimM [Mycoplasma mycoides]CAE77054.1 16S RRNA PROCESSING PROTEIN RIMM [Mycoplasma mycoides subsp. mycoides SC str. PG1]ADK69550.1 16S rRNA processing protein RimM [Mycoplasma mycoides subsp. mycoides SC str. Gladysdale]AIZ55288.1 Ribosome maturation factor RimM [Mycoplasma mycoides subsp. mycoides]AME10634.1 16S rRNA-processing protein RimM [Mycoplasma mycoides subsp. mycoides]AME11644.1 16S rRNA-processing protein RimM [Mycoplasma mycoides subsp. mycoides]
MNANLIKIGVIVNTFSIKGQVKVILNSDIVIDDLNKINTFFIETNDNFQVLRIQEINLNKNYLIVKFLNLNNINDVIKFKNKEIYCLKNQNITQLVSLINFKFTSFKTNGIIIDYMNNSYQQLIKVKSEDLKEFWVPLVDVFIKEIDYENQIIIAKNVEGLK